MTSDISPRLSLPFVQAAQAQKHVTVNESLWRLDAIVHLTVLSRAVTSQPQSPSSQDAYVLTDNPQGSEWSDYDGGEVLIFRDEVWERIETVRGFVCFVEDEQNLCVFDGTDWIVPGTDLEPAESFGVNTQADGTNRLSVKSDAVLLSHDDVTPGTGDMRVSMNKAASAGVTSLLLKTGYSARAEIGLIGNDDTVFKVSSDGSTFRTAISVDAETGQCRFPQTVLTNRKVQTFAPGTHTYVPAAGVCALAITVVGGGGGGAGAKTDAANQFVGAGGGGGGATAQKAISHADIAASYSIIVGNGGPGGSAAAGAGHGTRNGLDGGRSEVSAEGLLIKSPGGKGALEDLASVGATAFTGGDGGSASGGNLHISGQKGGSGVTKGSGAFQGGFGIGGAAMLGHGGTYQNGNGRSGSGYGGGGSGCGMIPGYVLNRSGGDGAPGIVIIEEFYG